MRPPSRRYARLLLWIAAPVLVAGTVSAGAIGFGGRTTGASPGVLPPATATVRRADLVEYLDVNGTLGYGPERAINARGAVGTVTSLPDVGSTVSRGAPVFTVDALSVVLLYGDLPLYRALQTGTRGADVRELEANLAALGYAGFTVDDTFSAATATAVRRWQHDLTLPPTGVVQPDQVVVAPGALRIAGHRAEVGDAASGALLTVTGTGKLVTVALKVDDAALATVGDAVTVTLAGDSGLPGTITAVGTVATAPGTAGQPADSTDATIPVTVRLTDQRAGGDGSPATVRLQARRRDNVLCVPVQSLLALREGGFGVEVVERGTSRIVAVGVGLFADGLVEITSGDLTEGTTVGMPG